MSDFDFDILDDTLSLMSRDKELGFQTWCENYGKIKAKNTFVELIVLNQMQRDIAEAVGWCLKNDKPIRLVIVKPRQKGCSTISVALMYWMMNLFTIEAVLIGAEYSQTDNLMEIFKRYAAQDDFNWGHERNVLEKSARFGNGSRLQRETANDDKAGRSGTFNFLCATEVSYWAESGVANASKVLAGILNCVTDLPKSCVILESTGNGPSGIFYEKFDGGVSLEDFKEGHEGNGFIKIFAPWHAFSDSVRELDPISAGRVVDSYTDAEKQMVSELGVSPQQMAYYRRILEEKCGGDPAKMQMDYPSSSDEAFHASSNQRFHSVGVKLLRSKAAGDKWDHGMLEGENDSNYTWIPTDPAGARLMMLERPIEGCRYNIGVDLAAGIVSDDGVDRDKHAALVYRSAYDDGMGRVFPPKVVARTVPVCEWPINQLEEYVFALSSFYGDCLIIPEENFDGGLIRGLVDRGANVYERMTDDLVGNVVKPKRSGRYGFRTTGGANFGSRDSIIERLDQTIRSYDGNQPGIEVDKHTGDELFHFERNPKTGRAEAASGHHDDSVIALAISNFLESKGTIYRKTFVRASIPKDLRDDFGPKRRKRGRGRFS
tara:strand:+ start:2502 stop:4307 length:1806 start_codon:yes stop_codon:yes gene_type:complete